MRVSIVDVPVFPCLGLSRKTSDLIVLFIDKSKGTVLTPVSEDHYLGEFKDDWNFNDFEIYEGDLTLSN